MLAIAQAIAPIFLIIVAGFAFKRARFPGEGFWQPAERLAYYVLLPALIVRHLAGADLAGIQVAEYTTLIVVVALATSALTLALKPLLRMDGPAFTSVLQGAIRLNSYIGFGIAEALWGAQGVVLVALFVAVMMPVVNVICIGVLAAFAHSGTPNWKRVPAEIAKNPIIVACAVGWALNALAVPLPGWVNDLLGIFAKGALPVALLCVGAGLDHGAGRGLRPGALALACGIKLLVMPAIALAAAHALGLTGLGFTVAVMFSAVPASPASYVLARQLGGDAALMAGILTAQTALAALTVPALVAWLG
jgi:hypothetical protein